MVDEMDLAVGYFNCDLTDSCDVVYILSVGAFECVDVVVSHLRRSPLISAVFGVQYCDDKNFQ